MKKIYRATAVTAVIMLAAAVATAGGVNIGLGRMDRSDFTALQQMVAGHYRPAVSVSTPIPVPLRVAEFNQNMVDAIRQAMATGSSRTVATASSSKTTMVDIGTGSMQTMEFCDLDKMVARNTILPVNGFEYICP
jgi:hypothetical protein